MFNSNIYLMLEIYGNSLVICDDPIIQRNTTSVNYLWLKEDARVPNDLNAKNTNI
jgi:hypothetical protein